MRPVDLQNNISKAPLVAREQHVQQTRPDQAQHQVAYQQGKKNIKDQYRVKANKNAESVRMNTDQQKKQQKKKYGSGKKQVCNTKKNTESPSTKHQLNKGQLLDFTI